MDILGQLEAQGLEQLNVEGETGQPFIAPHHMGGAHQVVVHRVGKVVGGNSVGFQKHLVNVILRDRQFSLYQIVKLKLIGHISRGAEAQHPAHSSIQLGFDVLQRTVTPDGILTIVAGGLLGGLLLFPHGGQLLFGAEAGIGHTLLHQLFGVHMVDVRPLPLAVGAVFSLVAIHSGALVKLDAIVLQGVNQHLHSPGNLPLGIGILYPQEQHTAALMGHALGGQALHQVAQVDKAGGGGSHAGNDGTLGHVPRGIFCFQLLRRHGDVGKKQLSQFLIIHGIYLFMLI